MMKPAPIIKKDTTKIIIHIALLLCTFACIGQVNAQESADLLEDDLLQQDYGMLNIPDFEKQSEPSWHDYFVTSLSHDQTRTDEGDTKYLRYAIRIEYEQAFAHGWYTRADVKGLSFRSLDKQAQERGQNRGMQTGEAYEHVKVHDAWVQYSKNACVMKAGNQTLIWGQVDGTFTVDDITPFDFTEQLLTDYSSIRLAQAMLVSECFVNDAQVQFFYNPEARLHLLNHNDDPYNLGFVGIDEDELDSEWGARYKFRYQKTEIAFMFADLIGNSPAQVIPDNAPATAPATLIPAISDYSMYGISANYSSGRWQVKSDIAYKTDQLVNQTASQLTDIIDIAVGLEYLSATNHSFSAGLWGSYDLDDEYLANQNNSTPFVTLSWNKSYINDDLSMSILANGRERPKSLSATLQAQYQYDDFWSFSGAITLADADPAAAANPLQSEDNEASLQLKYQF